MSSGRLRIVHCFRAAVGGVFRHVSDLADPQHRAGHAVGIICDSNTGGALEDQRFAALAPFLDLGLKRVPMRRQIAPSDIAATWRLMREIRVLNPDVLHGHGAKGGAYSRAIGTLLRASGVRVARIYSPHGGSLHYDPGSMSGRVYFTVERLFERMTDALVFVSQFEEETYARKVGKPFRPYRVIHNGVRPAEFEPVPPAADARDFLFIGDIRELKGTDVFVEAFATLAPVDGRAPTAWIVGDGVDKGRIEAMVRERGLGDRIGFRPPMPAREAFAMTRTIVVPSRAESMPYIILEAVAAEMPLVATRVGGIPEIFGAESARLVPPGDAVALSAAMADAFANPDAAHAAAAALRDQIRSGFSIEAMNAGILETYRSVTMPRD